MTATATPTADGEFRYGCCIDAGSSGSRIYLYRWPASKHQRQQQQQQPNDYYDDENDDDDDIAVPSSSSDRFIKVERKAIFSQERTPGISHESGLGIQAVQELAALAKAALPIDVNPEYVPIYLGATAGMRLIDSTSSHEAAATMAKLRRVLHQSGFLFRDTWARTITGEEEGAYAWLVANYLKHNGNFPMPTSSAYGALDLGGASTQISFLVSKDRTTLATESSTTSTMSSSDHLQQQQFPLRIDHLEYPIFTQSLLCYGVDQARILYDSKFASDKLPNPCYPSGYQDELSLISGSSNWEKCLRTVAKLFDHIPNNSHCGHGKQMRLGGGGSDGYSDGADGSTSSSHSIIALPQLPIENHQKFIAMSTFVYTWDYLGLRIGSETDDLNSLNENAQRVCNMPHTQQVALYEQHMEYKAIARRTTKPHTQCFNAAFSYHLLSKGYGLPLDKTPIEIHYEIGGTKVQWALGLMLVEVNKLSSAFHKGINPQYPHLQNEHNRWTCEICTYYGVLALVFVILIALPYRMKRSTSGDILPLVDRNGTDECTSPRKGK
ncbi:hypothetical protein ACHAWU_000268 [Discostella pseudostelligera]|uniref:Apyrase n=1 Tax=Discostella pseudostelligera TaxID=259834 RepID=A0ABD3MBL0_9STRA